MSKNLIPEIAKLLGVEIGEKFVINGVEYVFTETSLAIEDAHFCDCVDKDSTLLSLIKGEKEIVKLPWKPKPDDQYWSYIGPEFVVNWGVWVDRATELARLKCGMIFRTEEEALKERPRIYKELTGKDWSE